MGESEEQPGKEVMRSHSEKQASLRRENPKVAEGVLSRGQSERGGKAFWDTEQRESDPTRSFGSCVASEPLLPTETIMRPLCMGERQRGGSGGSGENRFPLDL